jgi:hypothetical protein
MSREATCLTAQDAVQPFWDVSASGFGAANHVGKAPMRDLPLRRRQIGEKSATARLLVPLE